MDCASIREMFVYAHDLGHAIATAPGLAVNTLFVASAIKTKTLRPATEYSVYHKSRDARKPVFGVSDQVRHKPACTSSEKS